MQNLSVCQLRTSNNMRVLDCGTKPEYLPRYAKYTQAGCETVMLFLGSNSADHPTFVLPYFKSCVCVEAPSFKAHSDLCFMGGSYMITLGFLLIHYSKIPPWFFRDQQVLVSEGTNMANAVGMHTILMTVSRSTTVPLKICTAIICIVSQFHKHSSKITIFLDLTHIWHLCI